MAARNLMIVQGGGPTAVFNVSLAAAVEQARERGFSKVYGARYGAAGLSKGDVCELDGLPSKELEALRQTPGAALGSSRFKPTADDLLRELDVLRALDVHQMLFLGGNGTMHGARLFVDFCASQSFTVQAIGVPKTVDNDLAETDRCPGYGSAARYVAQATQELGQDLRSLPQPVTILETMGRSVGWLAAAAVLAKQSEADAPHVVLLPETAFEQNAFLTHVEDAVRKHGYAVIVVAEGLRSTDGSLLYSNTDPAQQDALKRAMPGGVGRHLAGMVSSELKMRCRNETPGLLGRASLAHRAAQDVDDAANAGAAGVDALLAGKSGHMVALMPTASSNKTRLVPFEAVAGVERPIPAAWLDPGNPLGLNQQLRTYLQPFVGALPQHAAELPTLSLSTMGVH